MPNRANYSESIYLIMRNVRALRLTAAAAGRPAGRVMAHSVSLFYLNIITAFDDNKSFAFAALYVEIIVRTICLL